MEPRDAIVHGQDLWGRLSVAVLNNNTPDTKTATDGILQCLAIINDGAS